MKKSVSETGLRMGFSLVHPVSEDLSYCASGIHKRTGLVLVCALKSTDHPSLL